MHFRPRSRRPVRTRTDGWKSPPSSPLMLNGWSSGPALRDSGGSKSSGSRRFWPLRRNLVVWRNQCAVRRLKQKTEWERRNERSGNESRVGASAGRKRKAQEQGFSRVESQGQRERGRIPLRNGTFPRHPLLRSEEHTSEL